MEGAPGKEVARVRVFPELLWPVHSDEATPRLSYVKPGSAGYHDLIQCQTSPLVASPGASRSWTLETVLMAW